MTTWRERVAQARTRGKFTAEDCSKSCRWATCAIGEQRQLYPDLILYGPGRINPRDLVPVDPILYNLGSDEGFNGAVFDDNAARADTMLDAIEDRVLQLKREAQP